MKFARLAERADVLGFDAVATGHHARIGARRRSLARSSAAPTGPRTRATSCTCSTRRELARTLFPVGDVRDQGRACARIAAELGLRTAAKPDSQDVCFITSTGGRDEFLGRRIPFHPAASSTPPGDRVGTVAAVELVTIGQRTGLGLPGGGPKRYVVDVDRGDRDGRRRRRGRPARDRSTTVDASVVGRRAGRRRRARPVQRPRRAAPGDGRCDGRRRRRALAEPQRRVAPGQSVVFYDPTDRFVLGGGIAT